MTRPAALAALLLAVLLGAPRARPALLASSRLESCVLDGEDEQLTCERQLVVTLTVDGNQDSTERVESYVVRDLVDGESGETVTFTEPLVVTLGMAPQVYEYPLAYRRSYNNKPSEKVVGLDSFLLYSSCDDSASSGSPSCGWERDETGERILESQGFCCECSLAQQVGLDDDKSRGKQSCSLFGGGSSTAHCLRFDPLWYFAYEIDAPVASYGVVATVYSAIPYAEGGGYSEATTLVVGPEQALARTDDVLVRMVGSFVPTLPPPALTDRLLLVPGLPVDHERVRAGAAAWMTVEKSLVDDTGAACNKIGTSYAAFRNQGNRCGQLVGSCLAWQPDDLYRADLAARERGEAARYLVSGLGGAFDVGVRASNGGEELRLRYSNEQSRTTTVVTLTMRADTMRFVTNRSPGRISYATLAGFSSFSREGTLGVGVANTGSVAADFGVAVLNCSDGILPVPEQRATVPADSNRTFEFDVRSQNVFDALSSCFLVLSDSLGETLDELRVRFNTTAPEDDRGTQGGSLPPGDDFDDSYDDEFDCDGGCAFINLPCKIKNKCWSGLGSLLAVIAAAVLVPLLASMLVKSFCLGGGGGAGRSGKKARERRAAQRRERELEEEEEEAAEEARERKRHQRRRRRRRHRTVRSRASEADIRNAEEGHAEIVMLPLPPASPR